MVKRTVSSTRDAGRSERGKTTLNKHDSLHETGDLSAKNASVMFYTIEVFPTHDVFTASSAFKSLGYPLSKWKAGYKFWRTIIHPDDLTELKRKTAEAFKNKTSTNFTYRVITKSGEIRWLHDQTAVHVDEDRNSISWRGILIDITAQKTAEEELGKMASAYKTIVHHIPDSAVFIFDKDLRYTLVEGIALESHGISPEMLEGKTVYDFYPPDRAQTWANFYNAAIAGGYLYFEHVEDERFYQVHILPVKDSDGKIFAGLAMLQDITNRKIQEIELTENEAKYRELFENANDLVYLHDLEGNYVSINKATEKVFGYSCEEAIKLNVRDVVSPDHFEMVRQKINEKVVKGSDKTTYELDCIAKDGRKVVLEVNSRAVYEGQQIVGIQGIARNITARKQT